MDTIRNQIEETRLRDSGTHSVEPDRACHFGWFKRVSKSVQVLLNGLEAVLVMTLIILKWEFPKIKVA